MSKSTFVNPRNSKANYSDTYGMVKFVYRNWKGEIADRLVTPIDMIFDVNDFHDDAQWFLVAYDQKKKAIRNFAIQDIIGPITPVVARNNRVKHETNAVYVKRMHEQEALKHDNKPILIE